MNRKKIINPAYVRSPLRKRFVPRSLIRPFAR
jgi:hypothetical protein